MTDKKRVIITMQQGEMFDCIFAPDIMDDLKQHADVALNDLGRHLTTEELADRAHDVDAIITSWGAPRIDTRVIEAASKLRIISHAAGSVKHFIMPEVWDAGIVVTSAAYANGVYVGEFTLCLALAMLRTLPRYSLGAPADQWKAVPCVDNETLIGKTVGLIGLGQTARSFLRFLAPFNCNVIAFDPYVSLDVATQLGVRLVPLEEVLSTSKVVSVHAPVTEETKNMLNAENLGLIQDGAIFINTARGALIDHDALAKELSTGRFKAALDVTMPEPLPVDHPLRSFPNVLITPHIAGPTFDGRRDFFRSVVDDLKLFWAGREPSNVVKKEMLATMA